MTTTHSASNQANGYYYQAIYALYSLFQGKNELQIAVERLDDIETTNKDGLVKLIQTKHHKDEKHRISNSSIDFWKTIYIWSQYLHQNLFIPENTSLILVTTAHASTNSIPFLLSQEQRNTDVILNEIISYTKKTKSADIKRYAEPFIKLKEKYQRLLIQSIKVVDGACNILKIGDEISAHFNGIHKEHRESVYNSLLGWWFERLAVHMLDESTSFITKDEVETRLAVINDDYKKDSLPTYNTSIDFPQLSDLLKDKRKFIQQLQVIKIHDSRILNAMYEHDITVEHRTFWARTKLIFNKDLDQFDKSLIREWVECFYSITDKYVQEQGKMIEDAEEVDHLRLGQEIYSRVHHIKLNIVGKAPPLPICRGSFHMLADTSPSRIGWHPQFKEIFDKDIVEVEQK